MSYNQVIEGFKDQNDAALEAIIIDYKGRIKLGNVYAYIELKKRGKTVSSACLDKLKEFAIHQGFNDWETYFNNFQTSNSDIASSNPDTIVQRAINIGERYPALKIVSGAIAFIAWTVGILAVIIALVLFTNSRGEGTWVLPLGTFVIGLILFISLLAYSEIIKVFVDIEENTRKAVTK